MLYAWLSYLNMCTLIKNSIQFSSILHHAYKQIQKYWNILFFTRKSHRLKRLDDIFVLMNKLASSLFISLSSTNLSYCLSYGWLSGYLIQKYYHKWFVLFRTTWVRVPTNNSNYLTLKTNENTVLYANCIVKYHFSLPRSL